MCNKIKIIQSLAIPGLVLRVLMLLWTLISKTNNWCLKRLKIDNENKLKIIAQIFAYIILIYVLCNIKIRNKPI